MPLIEKRNGTVGIENDFIDVNLGSNQFMDIDDENLNSNDHNSNFIFDHTYARISNNSMNSSNDLSINVLADQSYLRNDLSRVLVDHSYF